MYGFGFWVHSKTQETLRAELPGRPWPPRKHRVAKGSWLAYSNIGLNKYICIYTYIHIYIIHIYIHTYILIYIYIYIHTGLGFRVRGLGSKVT